MAVRVIIALGSNHQQAVHIKWASERLAVLMTDVKFSRTIWTEDIHGTGRFYMNRLASGTTSMTATELERQLKAIETVSGRTHDCVTIDLDLMQYADQQYHEHDWPRPYIQQLISDIQ